MNKHPLNRPHQVDAATGDFLYALYELLFSAPVEPRIKQMTFETGAVSKDHWRVVSISQDALAHISNEKISKGLRRGHLLSRVDRADHLFNRPTPLSKTDLLQYFFEHDTVAMVTVAENGKNGTDHWSKLHPVPEGHFTGGSFSIYVRKGLEIPWVSEILSNQQKAA